MRYSRKEKPEVPKCQMLAANILKLLSFMKSKAKSIALVSAVKIEEPAGKRNVLQLPFVKVAQPTLFSSFEPSV